MIETPRVKVKRSDILRKAEITRMLEDSPDWLRCLIALSWAFGKRISENLLLKREDVWTTEEFLTVRFPVVLKKRVKESYIKQITLEHPAVPYILDYVREIKEGSLFSGMTRQLALYYLKKVNPDSYLHLFRRSLATEMSERSFTVQQLMAWFDWTEPKVAMDYVKRGPGLTKELSKRTW